MNVNRHKYFRWTPRTAWITFAYVVVVPAMLGTAGYMTDVGCAGTYSLDELTEGQGKWDMRGKRRGDLVSEF